MDAIFLLKAFFTGFCTASALGPVFIMTFNRAALHGMYLGVATAVGSALTDGLLFFFVMSGVLGRMNLSSYMLLGLDVVGAVAMFGLSWHYWKTVQDLHERVAVQNAWELIAMTINTFFMTLLNPSAMLLFVFVSMKLFGSQIGNLNLMQASFGGFFVAAGTFCALSLVSYGASFVGARLSPERLKKILNATAIFLTAVGLLLLIDALSLWLRCH